jgi:glycosyltransferase involved in cell wall biosynthesis
VEQPRRVLLDATAIPEKLGGVGRYLEGLIPALDKQPIELTIVAQQRDAEWISALAPRATIATLAPRWTSRGRRLVWEQFGLPRLAARLGVDVLHSPHYTRPLAARLPVVVTIHDATFFSHPEHHTWVKVRFFRWWSRSSYRKAAAIVVPSAATASALEEFLGAPPVPVHVAHHGVDPDVFRRPTASETAALAAALDVNDAGWIAFLGTIEPRKNVPNLVRAYAAVCAESSTPMPTLILGGARGWDQETKTVIDGLDGTVDVRLAGYLPKEQLAGFLGGAQVFIYPSVTEGFGLPVLEAMACGAAVVTTRDPALSEVGGDAVEYTGLSADEIATTLRAVLGNSARRKQLSALAVARASTFSWNECARAHVTAYTDASGVNTNVTV